MRLTRLPFAAAALTVVLLASLALAQDATVTPTVVVPAPGGLQALAIAIITAAPPMVIAVVKWIVPKVPSMWLPLLAPFVGMLVSIAAYYATGTEVSVIVAAFAGLAGVGLREAYDQLMQRLKAPPPSAA